MGLDIALGVIIFLAAIRGWIKGFLYQTVRIAGLIACVYLAAPVRQQVRPHLAPHFTSIQPEMLDRILWWGSCVASYVVLVGLVSLLIAISRRPEEPGMKPTGGANDRLGGFLLGAAKGALVATFITAGIQKYAISQVAAIPWAQDQLKGSKALSWNQTYEPVPLIWQSGPVRQFVAHVQKMGMAVPEQPPTPGPAVPRSGQAANRATAQNTEGRNPRLTVPQANAVDAGSLASEIDANLNDIKSRIEKGSTATPVR